MDTTSHEFVWTVDTIGVRSYLYDVAIINENNVWAVGEIHLNNNDTLYDVAQWNGLQWNFLKASGFPAYAVYAFSANDVWIGTTAPHHWNGQSWIGYNVTGIFNGYIKRMWGISSSNLYIVGSNGSMAHFNGSQWTKLESGTSINLRDIWGSPDGSNLWACGYRGDQSESILLHSSNGTSWQEYGHAPPYGIYQDLFSSVWFPRNDSAYVVGNKNIFRHSPNSATGYKKNPLTLGNFPYCIRGNDRNDIVIAGDDGMVWHFNGVTWKRYAELFNPLDDLSSVAISGNTIVAVGGRYYNGIRWTGIIYKGVRQ